MLVSMANDNLNLFTQRFNGTILSGGTPGTPRLVGSGWPSEVSFTVKVQPLNWLSHIYCVLNWSFYIVTWSNLFSSTLLYYVCCGLFMGEKQKYLSWIRSVKMVLIQSDHSYFLIYVGAASVYVSTFFLLFFWRLSS